MNKESKKSKGLKLLIKRHNNFVDKVKKNKITDFKEFEEIKEIIKTKEEYKNYFLPRFIKNYLKEYDLTDEQIEIIDSAFK